MPCLSRSFDHPRQRQPYVAARSPRYAATRSQLVSFADYTKMMELVDGALSAFYIINFLILTNSITTADYGNTVFETIKITLVCGALLAVRFQCISF